MTDLYATTILAEHPVGYWRLNERLVTDPVVDESGNGHHGTIAGQPILTERSAIQGIADNSITFVPDSYIEILHSPAFSIQSSGQGLTVEVWMRPDTLMFQGEEGKNYIHWLGKGQRARCPKEEEKMEKWNGVFDSTPRVISNVQTVSQRMPGIPKAGWGRVPITQVISSRKVYGSIWLLVSSLMRVHA